MTKKNIILSIVLVVFITISVGLGLWQKGPTAQFDSQLFALEDVDQIDRIVMTRGSEVMDCRAFSQGFLINETYPMDQNLMLVLASVLQQVRIQRPLSTEQKPEGWKLLQDKGTFIQVYAGESLLREFWAGGDAALQQSYFAQDQENIYLVNLPGYSSYLGGLFELDISGWRSKNIFQSTWRSILSFSMENLQDPQKNFRIDYRDPFFSVPGIQKLDSNRVINYLQTLGAMRAYQLVDSSPQDDPWLRMTTIDINEKRNVVLTLYHSDSLILGTTAEQAYLFQPQQIAPLIQEVDYFRRQEGSEGQGEN